MADNPMLKFVDRDQAYPAKRAAVARTEDFREIADRYAVQNAEDQSARYLEQLQTAFMRTVEVATTISEMRDPYTAGHAERVAEYAQYIGLELGIPPGRLERLRLAALMHDVGKLVVPNHLLNKPGKLTAEEFAIVRKHEDVSVEILTTIEFLAPVAPLLALQCLANLPVETAPWPELERLAAIVGPRVGGRPYRLEWPPGQASGASRSSTGRPVAG